jgi:hypothetical protein
MKIEEVAMQPEGLTLRDYFAGQALAALPHLARPRPDGKPVERVADASYAVADAMLARREKDGRLRDHEIENLTRRAEVAERSVEVLRGMREVAQICLAAEHQRQKKLKPGSPASTYTADRIAKLESPLK